MCESNYIIIRLAPDKLDGQVVFWAAGGVDDLQDHACGPDFTDPFCTTAGVYDGGSLGNNTRKLEWSPDYGDYFANVNPRLDVQDMEAESSTILYVMNSGGSVQKLPYTGTAWSSAVNTVSTKGGGGHTIDVQAEGIIVVGGTNTSPFPAAISTNGASSFGPMVRPTTGDTPLAGYHAILDTDYADNETIYLGSDGGVADTWEHGPARSGATRHRQAATPTGRIWLPLHPPRHTVLPIAVSLVLSRATHST
jgi:hypothetical protein